MSTAAEPIPFQHLVDFLNSKITNTPELKCVEYKKVPRLTPRDAAEASPSIQTVTVMRLQQGSSYVPTVLVLVDLGWQGPAAASTPDDEGVKKLASDLETASLIVRTQLKNIEEADELVLWFIAPQNAKAHPGWEALRQEALRDTSICPKNGWLPTGDPASWDQELMAFLDETFLSTPWKLDTDAGADGGSEVDLVTVAEVDREAFETFRSALLGDGTSPKRVEETAPDLSMTPGAAAANPVDALWTWAEYAETDQEDAP